MIHCLINPDDQIVARREYDPEHNGWHIPDGWRIASEAECTELEDAPAPTPSHTWLVSPEGWRLSVLPDDVSNYNLLATAYLLQSAAGQITGASDVVLGAEGQVRTVTYTRFTEIFAGYAAYVIQLRLSGG